MYIPKIPTVSIIGAALARYHDLRLGIEGVYMKELGRGLDKVEWKRKVQVGVWSLRTWQRSNSDTAVPEILVSLSVDNKSIIGKRLLSL